MTTALESLIACGTQLWLDSIDPDLVRANRAMGASGATSNPIIVSDLIRTGRFDARLRELQAQAGSDDEVTWRITDALVADAQRVFEPVFEATRGDDGYVSFELDPLLEDAGCTLDPATKSRRYVELGLQWSRGHRNRMIKVPATPAGLGALEELAAAGVPLNVTLIFSARQYHAAREAVWRGAQRRKSLDSFKSVYSIFVSRIDVYTRKQLPQLPPAAQGQVGIVNVQRIWRDNQTWWADKHTPLRQQIVFASTGTKDPNEPADKYVAALAGSDIQTNPPATNAAVQAMTGRTYTRRIDVPPPPDVLAAIDAGVDFARMEQVLMAEGLEKFAEPQKALLALVASLRGR